MGRVLPRAKGPRVKRSTGSSLTMPLQGLNLNEYGIESGVSAPQARNFTFLGRRSAKIFFLFIGFLLPRRLARLSFGVIFFFWGGANDMFPPF